MFNYLFGPEWGPSVETRRGIRLLRSLGAFVVASPESLERIGDARIGDVIDARPEVGAWRARDGCLSAWQTAGGVPVGIVGHGLDHVASVVALGPDVRALLLCAEAPRSHRTYADALLPRLSDAIEQGLEPTSSLAVADEIRSGHLVISHPWQTGIAALSDCLRVDAPGPLEMRCHHFVLPYRDGKPVFEAIEPIPREARDRDPPMGITLVHVCTFGGLRSCRCPAPEAAPGDRVDPIDAAESRTEPLAHGGDDGAWCHETDDGPYFIASAPPSLEECWDFDPSEVGEVPCLIDADPQSRRSSRAVLSLGMLGRPVTMVHAPDGTVLVVAVDFVETPDDEEALLARVLEELERDVRDAPSVLGFDPDRLRPARDWTLCRLAFDVPDGRLRLEPIRSTPRGVDAGRRAVEVRCAWIRRDGPIEWRHGLPESTSPPPYGVVAEVVVVRLP